MVMAVVIKPAAMAAVQSAGHTSWGKAERQQTAGGKIVPRTHKRCLGGVVFRKASLPLLPS